jgi:ribosomal protein S18 acetylase RimI-like enzyme
MVYNLYEEFRREWSRLPQMSAEHVDRPGRAFRIEKAHWRDLNALRSLEQVCFPLDAWPIWDLIGVLTLPNVVRLKAVVAEKMVGFIGAEVKPSELLAWIGTVGVLPEYRKQGIGEALIEACEAEIETPRVRLCVRLSNHEAIRLYERLGYQRISIWPRYYINGEDAAVMEKYR